MNLDKITLKLLLRDSYLIFLRFICTAVLSTNSVATGYLLLLYSSTHLINCGFRGFWLL